MKTGSFFFPVYFHLNNQGFSNSKNATIDVTSFAAEMGAEISRIEGCMAARLQLRIVRCDV